jgi:hypothetical protein
MQKPMPPTLPFDLFRDPQAVAVSHETRGRNAHIFAWSNTQGEHRSPRRTPIGAPDGQPQEARELSHDLRKRGRFHPTNTHDQQPAPASGGTWLHMFEPERQQPRPRLRWSGAVSRAWQAMGSNHRRLSRRFYSPNALPERPLADQRGRAPRCDFGLPPSAMRPWAQDSGTVRVTDGGETRHGRGRKNPRTGPVGAATPTVRPGFMSLTWYFMVPNSLPT